MAQALLNTHVPSFDSPIAMKKQEPSLETNARHSGDLLNFQDDDPQNSPKRQLFDTKSAIEGARRLETARNLFVVMRVCPPVVLSYFDAGFEPMCGRKDFLTSCCCLLLLFVAAAAAKMCCSSLDRKRWCKTSTG